MNQTIFLQIESILPVTPIGAGMALNATFQKLKPVTLQKPGAICNGLMWR